MRMLIAPKASCIASGPFVSNLASMWEKLVLPYENPSTGPGDLFRQQGDLEVSATSRRMMASLAPANLSQSRKTPLPTGGGLPDLTHRVQPAADR